MERLDNKRAGMGGAVCLAGLFLALFLLCRLFPVVGDDWYREALGASIHGPGDLLREAASRWATVNGRVLGNILAYAAGSRPLLRELLRAAFTLALIALLAGVTRVGGWRGLLLWTAAALALPREMFCQIYPWAAGFFNYVPPVVMLLACLVLVRPVLDGRPLEEGSARGAALFLLGFGQQLFIENNTLYALCAALVLLVWYRLERRKWSPCLLALLAGCVLGAALLFASPSYRLVGQAGGAYQSGLAGGLAGLVTTARENLTPVARHFILDCPVLYGSLTALVLLLGWKRRGASQRLLGAALAMSCLWLAWGGWRPLWGAAVWWLLLTAGLWLWTPDRPARAWGMFLWLSAPAAAGPLLFVSPIGPRCLFLSYVLLLAAGGTLLRALEPERLPALFGRVVPGVLAAAVLGLYFAVFLPIHRTELQRDGILRDAIAAGDSEAAIPGYDHRGWLWDADNGGKMKQVYYREEPGDLEIWFLGPCPGED